MKQSDKKARVDGLVIEIWFLIVVTGLVMALAWHILPSSKPASVDQQPAQQSTEGE